MADALDMPVSKVRVTCEYMGGGFGSKGQTLKQPVIAALLSRMSGRPVKLMLSRHEENLLTGNRGETIQKYKIGARRDGSLQAIDLEAMYGAGPDGSPAPVPPPVGPDGKPLNDGALNPPPRGVPEFKKPVPPPPPPAPKPAPPPAAKTDGEDG